MARDHIRISALTWLNISPNGDYYILRGLYQGGDGDGDVRRDFSIFARDRTDPLHRIWGFFDDVPMLPSWSGDGHQVMYWGWSQELTKPRSKPFIGLLELSTQNEARITHPALKTITPTRLAWSPDKRWLAIGDVMGMIHLFKL